MKQIAALTLGVGLTAALSLSALAAGTSGPLIRSEEHTSELQSLSC